MKIKEKVKIPGAGIIKLNGQYAISENDDIKELNYNLNDLTAKDFLKIEREFTYDHEFVLTSKLEFIDFYSVLVAAKASKIPIEVLDVMSIQDISIIKNTMFAELTNFSHSGLSKDLEILKLEVPIIMGETTVEEINFDFSSLKGVDLRDIERTYQKRGTIPTVKKQFSEAYCLTCAAKSAKINLSTFDKLSWRDHKTVVTLVQTFLQKIGA